MRQTTRTRLAALVVVLHAVLLASAQVTPTDAAEPNPRSAANVVPDASADLADIEDEVMCPVCGTTLQVANGPQAERERDFIRREIAAGRTKNEIKDDLVQQFGSDILSVPAKHGFSLVVWLIPAAVIVFAGSTVVLVFRRRRRDTPSPTANEMHDVDQADLDRLDQDLTLYRQ